MRQSGGCIGKVAGGSALLAGGVSTDVICRRFRQTHSLLLQPATKSVRGPEQSPALTARVTQLGKLDGKRRKVGPYRPSKEVFADLQIGKVKLKHSILLGAWLARWRTALFRL